MSSVILTDQVSPLPCFYSNSTETGKLTIIVHSWSVRVRQTISIACWLLGEGRREVGRGGTISTGNYFPGEQWVGGRAVKVWFNYILTEGR